MSDPYGTIDSMDTCISCGGNRIKQWRSLPHNGFCWPCYDKLLEERRQRRAAAPTCLYRLHDPFGVLLYVGVSMAPRRRWKEHRTWMWWWPQVADKTTEWYPDEATARRAELAAIRTELPRFNGIGYGEEIGTPAGPGMPDGVPPQPAVSDEEIVGHIRPGQYTLEWLIWRALIRETALTPEEQAVVLGGRIVSPDQHLR